jgi:hypothetical protein
VESGGPFQPQPAGRLGTAETQFFLFLVEDFSLLLQTALQTSIARDERIFNSETHGATDGLRLRQTGDWRFREHHLARPGDLDALLNFCGCFGGN